MGWLLAIEQVPQVLGEAIFSLTDSRAVFLALVVVFVLIIGCVVDLAYGMPPVTVPPQRDGPASLFFGYAGGKGVLSFDDGLPKYPTFSRRRVGATETKRAS